MTEVKKLGGELVVGTAFFALQGALHVATFFPGSELTVWHAIGALVVAMISTAALLRVVPNNPMLRNLPVEREARLAAQKAMRREMPAWFRVAQVVVGLYLLCAVAVAVYAQRNGSPEVRDGEYWAGNSKLRIAFHRIDAPEYWRLEAHLVRVVSGASVTLSYLPIAAIIWYRARLKNGRA